MTDMPLRLRDASPNPSRWPTGEEILDHLGRVDRVEAVLFLDQVLGAFAQLTRRPVPTPQPPAPPEHALELNMPPHPTGWHCRCGWRFTLGVTRARAFEVWAQDPRHADAAREGDPLHDTIEREYRL